MDSLRSFVADLRAAAMGASFPMRLYNNYSSVSRAMDALRHLESFAHYLNSQSWSTVEYRIKKCSKRKK